MGGRRGLFQVKAPTHILLKDNLRHVIFKLRRVKLHVVTKSYLYTLSSAVKTSNVNIEIRSDDASSGRLQEVKNNRHKF